MPDYMRLFLFLTSLFWTLYVSSGIIRLFDNFIVHTGNFVAKKWLKSGQKQSPDRFCRGFHYSWRCKEPFTFGL